MKELAERIGQTRAPITPQFRADAGLLSNSPDMEFPELSMRYRDWQIGTKVIHGQLWLQWQHPQEKFPRYAIQVFDNRIADTIARAQLLIDLIISLEKEAASNPIYPQVFTEENAERHSLHSHVHPHTNGSNSHSAPVSSSDTWKDQEEFSLIENRWG